MNPCYQPTGREIADALGISPSRVSQLRRDGMPIDSIEAARAWYKRRVDPVRAVGQRQSIAARRDQGPRRAADELDTDKAPSAAEAVGLVCTVAVAASESEAAARAYLPALRVAMREVPADARRFVVLPEAVWRLLAGDNDRGVTSAGRFVRLDDAAYSAAADEVGARAPAR